MVTSVKKSLSALTTTCQRICPDTEGNRVNPDVGTGWRFHPCNRTAGVNNMWAVVFFFGKDFISGTPAVKTTTCSQHINFNRVVLEFGDSA